MSTLYIDVHCRTRKRLKVEAAAAIERISHRKIVIERGALKSVGFFKRMGG
jgi:GTPase Era involved in 16S rRNA processing